jgi:hypothetical protein
MKKKIYSKDLGINLKSGREEELFKWFNLPFIRKTNPSRSDQKNLF